MRPNAVSLAEIAQQAMIDRGFIPDFPETVVRELDSIPTAAMSSTAKSFRDMRELLWVSVDNDDSLDLDQLTFAEKVSSGKDKIYVAVADVDALVPSQSAMDGYAAHNTTSVYTPTKIFPMLPAKLSTDLTSLNEGVDRCAIVVEMEIDAQGQWGLNDVYPALVHNHAKLAYRSLGAWLEEKGPLPPAAAKIAGMQEQLKLQDAIAQRIKAYRFRLGALSFDTFNVQPIVSEGFSVGLEEVVPNRADALIENYMIAANVSVTGYMIDRKLPFIRRIVRTPKRWDRIIDLAKSLGTALPSQPDVKALQSFLVKQHLADSAAFADLSLLLIKLIGKGEYYVGLPGEPSPGHFDLALLDYAHTTAPNRRYPDLIIQRLLKSHFLGQGMPYDSQQLIALADHCTEKEDDANKVERRVHKSAVAMVLEQQIGRQFDAEVTGASDKGTWVRLVTPPIEGKLIQGEQGLDVGDRLAVRLTYVDVPNGYIDFVNVAR